MASDIRAFPTYAHPDSHAGAECSGMTLRDWFAGQALTDMIGLVFESAVAQHGEVEDDWVFPIIAKKAYAVADAMLVERERVA